MNPDARSESTNPPRTRFAPAPTGYLHLGGARTALFNWLFARGRGGKFILRIEDTDLERSRGEMTDQVLNALKWLGLDWDEGPGVGGDCAPYFQSERRAMHIEHAERLLKNGRAYECYMSSEELEARRKTAIAAGKPFRYEGWHRELSREQIAAFQAEGRKPAIRLRVDSPAQGHVVHDLIKGDTHFPPDQIDDFILLRSDGNPSFHLANVVDDATMRITHVIRGEDHLTNTCRHQVLFEALEYPLPQYGHVPMILGADRSKLSKRHGAVSVMDYANQGYLPDAMVNELALLGWSSADGKEELSRAELIERFDLSRCGKSASIFDFSKLDHFNRVRIKAMSIEDLKRELEPFARDTEIPADKFSALIELLRDETVKLTDFAPAAKRLLDPPAYEEAALADPALKNAKAVLEALIPRIEAQANPLSREAFKVAIKEAGAAAGIKGKELFMPIRFALTGSLHGPALDGVAAILGKTECLNRIRRFVAK